MKYYKLVLNARSPKGFWGKMMINSMNKNHYGVTTWGLSHYDFKDTEIVLDIGCGGGKTVNRLSEMVKKTYGVDYSDLAVEKSIKLNKKQIKNNLVEIQKASVSNLPFEESFFDVAVAVETYYFWPDKLNDLKEIKRVLKSKGTLLMIFEMCKEESEPDKWIDVEKLIDIKAPTQQEIETILKEVGYINIKSDKVVENTWLVVTAQKE